MYLLRTQEKLPSQLGFLPSGADGVRATLELMRGMVRTYKKIPQFRDFAAKKIKHLPQKAYNAEINTLFEYVRDCIRYMRDVRDVETLQTPDVTVKLGYGDCDDKSVLLATLLEATGHPTRFVAIGTKPGRYQHVYVETLSGKKWIPLDPTEPQPMGWKPANIVEKMRVNN